MAHDGGTGVEVDRSPRGRVGRVLAVVVATTVVVGGVLAVLAVGLLFAALANGGDGRVEGISIDNRTADDLTIVYLIGGRDTSDGTVPVPGSSREVATVTARDQELLSLPGPARESCTLAPLVARRSDGTEVSRLHAGICTDDTLVEWTIT